jgi:hypothetical protein
MWVARQQVAPESGFKPGSPKFEPRKMGKDSAAKPLLSSIGWMENL